MALKGNLRDFTITQLLNLINLARKTGALVIEGPSDSATITFRDGKLAYAHLGASSDNGLGPILHNTKVITKAQFSTLKKRASEMSDKELGLLLINSGYVTQEDIITSLQTHFMDILNKLFAWAEGIFQFNNGESVPDDKIPVRMDLENIIMEGSRHLRELEQLKDELPNLDMALKFTDRPGVNLRSVNMSVEEWRVVSYINPKNSITQISKATSLNDMEIRRIVYSLLQAGLVELIRPEGGPEPLPDLTSAIPGANKDEQKTLVNRLIGRIRSL